MVDLPYVQSVTHSSSKIAILTLIVLGWSSTTYASTKFSLDDAAFGFARPLVYLLVPTGLAYACRWLLVRHGLNQHMIVGYN